MAISYVGAGAVVKATNNPTLTVPAGVVERDLLVIIATYTGSSTAPAGWTSRFVGGSTPISIFYKFASASESSVTVNVTSNVNSVMIAYRGVGANDTISAIRNVTSSSVSTNTLTTTFPDEYIISVFTCDSNATTFTVPGGTTSRVNSSGTATANGLLIVDELQAAAGLSTSRTTSLGLTSRVCSAIAFSIVPGGEDKYWVGGSGTWDTTSTTNWSLSSGGASGALPPGENESVFFDQAGTYTVTMTGALDCLDITVSTGTVTFATGTTPTLAISGAMSLVASTVWTNTGAITFNSYLSKTITTNGVTINSPIIFAGPNNVGGAWSLGSALSTGATVTTTLTSGTLTLNGFDLTTGIFSSSNTNTRVIEFGSNNIVLAHTTAAQTVLSMATATSFTYTGTGGFTADASVTRTYVFGTTGGSITNAPKLSLTGSDTAVGTFTTGSWFGSLNFGTTAFNPGTTSLNIVSSLTLSSSGTFTGLTVIMVSNGTITSNGTTIAALTISTGTTTLGDALTTVSTGTTTFTTGTLDLNGFNLTTGIFSSNNANTRVITFGSNFIYLVHTTAATTVLNLANSNLSWTGTGGFSTAMTVTRTFVAGTTPNTLSAGVNLFITSGSAAITFTSGDWYSTLDFTGSTSTATVTASAVNVTTLVLASGGTYSGLNFTTYKTGTLTTNGKSIGRLTVGNIVYTLLTTSTTLVGNLAFGGGTGALTVAEGTFNTNNYNISGGGAFTSTGSTIRAISLGSSSISITSLSFDVPNLTFNAGTSTITYTSAGSLSVTGGGLIFYNVVYSSTSGSSFTMTGTNTFNDLTLFTNISAGTNGGYVITDDIIVNGTFTIPAPTGSVGGRFSLSSATLGTQVTITANAVSLNTVNFRDINAQGSSIPWTGTSLGNAGNNSNITFTTGVNKYWSLAAGGNWNSTAWATTSGGTPSAANYPLPQDSCIIENTGLNTGATITINVDAIITSLNMSTRTNSMNLNIGTGTNFYLTGDWINGSGLTSVGGTGGGINFVNTTSGIQNITSAGKLISPDIFVNTNGTVKLLDNLDQDSTVGLQPFTLTAGTLNLNNFSLSTAQFVSSNTNTRAISFGTGYINLTHTTAGTTVLSMSDATNFTGSGTGGFRANMSVTRTFGLGSTGAPTVPANLFIYAGASIPSISTGSYFTTLDFTGSTCTPATSTINLYSLTLASGGTYTNLTINTIGTGTITPNAKTLVALTCLSGTTTLSGTLTAPTTVNGGTLTNPTGSVLNAVTFTLTTGTVNLTGGTLPTTTTFSHTAGSVNITSAIVLLATCAYGFTSGTITLGANLTVGIFNSNNSNTRSIDFSTNTILLNATATTVLDMATLTGFTPIGTGGFAIGDMTTPRTITCGSTAGGSTATAPNLRFTTGGSITNSGTITSGSWFNKLDYAASLCSGAWPATTVNVSSITLSASMNTTNNITVNIVGSGTITCNGKSSGTMTLLAGTPTFADTCICTSFVVSGLTYNFTTGTINPTTSFVLSSGEFIYNGGTLGAVPTFTHTAGTVTLNSSYSLTVTGTYTLTAGTLTLADGVTLTTGIFSSSNTNTRSIAFGSTSAGNINLTHTTAATVVLSMATLTGFTYTGPGGFTVADMANTRTFTCGTTGGTITNAPNLTFTSGAGVATITTAGWFKTLDFGTTSFTIAATSLNLINLITSSSSGVLTALTATMRDTGTVYTTNRIGPLVINHSGTTTMQNLATNLCTTLTVTSGNLVLESNCTLNCTTTATLSGGTLLNYEGVLTCTTFTIAGSTFVLSAGSIQPSVSFVITSGAFTLNYSAAGGLSAVPTFTHTAGTVQFNTSYSLTATGTYTFTAGTLTINDNMYLTTGIFSSSNANTRTINFGLTTAPGYIVLSHTTAATTVLSMAIVTGLTVTAITNTVPAGGFISDTTITRTFTCGTTGGNAANSPCLYFSSGTALPTLTTGSWYNILYLYNLGAIGTLAATTLNLNGLVSSPGGGVYTSMTVNFVGTGTVQCSGISSGPVNINNGSGLLTVFGALVSTTCTFTSGSVDFNGYYITPTTTFTYLGGTFVNGPFITCTTFTLNGPTLTLNYPYIISPTTSFVVTTGTFTLNDGSLATVPTFTQTAGNVTFNQNYSLTTTGTYTLTAGTLTLAPSVTLNTGIFSSTGAGIRSIAFGTTSAGNINLTHTTAATVVLNMAALGGFSYTGTGGFTVADMANTRTFSVGNTSGGSLTTAPRLTFTTGASIPTLTTAGWFNNLDFGTTSFTLGTTSLNLTGDLTLSSSGTYTGLTAIMVDTGVATLTTNGKTIAALTINGPAGSFTFAGIVTVTGALTLTSGTVYTSYAINSASFASTGTATRGIIGTNITYTVSGAGATAFSNASGTGLTMSGFIINMTNAAAKTFAGGGGTYPVLNQAGAGALTISGSNTFGTISASVQPTTFTFTSLTTQTVNNFDVDGIAGSLVTINSSTAASAATLSKASGTVYGAYLSIRDSTATGGATWYAGPTSTNVSNNTGWIFARLPIITLGSLTMDTSLGGITISNDPIPV